MSSGAPPRHRLPDGYSFCRVINGGWQLSPGHGEHPWTHDEVLAGWSRRVEAGLTTFDVADIYGGVEQLAGRLANRFESDRVQIHTKCVPNRSQLASLSDADVGSMVDGSLSRLGVERLDLVQLHWWDFSIDGWVDALEALDRRRDAGKIRHLGVTNFDSGRLEPLLETGLPISTNQVQYSLLDRRPEDGLTALAERHGLALLAYGSLAGGFLTRQWFGRPKPDADALNRSLVKYLLVAGECGGWDALQARLAAIDRVAGTHDRSIAEVALRWSLDRAGVGAAIVGAVGDRHLESVLRTFEFQLSEDDHRLLDEAAPDGLRGEVYRLERESSSHAGIMRTELQPDSGQD